MIPTFLREAFARPEDAARAEPVVIAPAAIEVDRGEELRDPVQRYALVGIFTIMAITALYLAKSVAMPIVAGIVFGLILGPITDRLSRLGLPQGAAAAVVVLAGFLVMLALFAALAAPFAIWSDQLPGIVSALQDRVRDMLDALSNLTRLTEGLAPAAPSVTVSEGSPWISVAGYSSSAFGGLLIFLGTLYFYLASRRAFRARALKLCLGRQARQLAHEYLDEIESRVAAYFGVVTVVNLGMGAATGLIAWLAGLPFPAAVGLRRLPAQLRRLYRPGRHDRAALRGGSRRAAGPLDGAGAGRGLSARPCRREQCGHASRSDATSPSRPSSSSSSSCSGCGCGARSGRSCRPLCF